MTEWVCDRCGALLVAGKSNAYVVKIEAYADPTPPALDEATMSADTGETIKELLRQMEGMSEQELMDQVHRRMTLHLCGGCYRAWIERPVG